MPYSTEDADYLFQLKLAIKCVIRDDENDKDYFERTSLLFSEAAEIEESLRAIFFQALELTSWPGLQQEQPPDWQEVKAALLLDTDGYRAKVKLAEAERQ
jgi:hypothetical protein